MPWDEFCALLSGLDADTPLGKVVRIRTETDPEVLKNYTPEMNRIRYEWNKKTATPLSHDDIMKMFEGIKNAYENE